MWAKPANSLPYLMNGIAKWLFPANSNRDIENFSSQNLCALNKDFGHAMIKKAAKCGIKQNNICSNNLTLLIYNNILTIKHDIISKGCVKKFIEIPGDISMLFEDAE